MIRKIIFFLLALLPLGLASYALAADGFVALAPIPGLTKGEVANSYDLPAFFNNLYKYLIGIAAILAIIEIIWGGLEISTKDSVSKQSDGKERIRQAIFGLILVLSPALVFGIINPEILNLRVALEPIKLDFTTYTPSVTSTPDTYDPNASTVTYTTCDLNTDALCTSAMSACTRSSGSAVGRIKCVKYPESNGVDTTRPNPDWNPTATPCRVGWRPGVVCTIPNTSFGVGA